MANVRICLVSSPTPFTPKPGMKEELQFCLPKVGPTTPTLGTEAPRYFHSRGSFLAFHCCTKTSQENRTKNPQGGCSISPQERWLGHMGSRRARHGPGPAPISWLTPKLPCVWVGRACCCFLLYPQSSQPGFSDTPRISRDVWKLTENRLIKEM